MEKYLATNSINYFFGLFDLVDNSSFLFECVQSLKNIEQQQYSQRNKAFFQLAITFPVISIIDQLQQCKS